MKTLRRSVAAAELLLLFPAALFMTALFVRNLQPQQFEPAHTAARIVGWYAARTQLGLWVFLMALPLAVLVVGSITLARMWRSDAALRQTAAQAFAVVRLHFAALLIAIATVAAAGVLAIVALHMVTD